MPILVAWIGEMLLSVVGRLAISALISCGIGFAVHAVAGSDTLEPLIASTFANAGPLYAYINFLGIGTAMTIVLSAWAGREITDQARAYVTENFSPKLKGGH